MRCESVFFKCENQVPDDHSGLNTHASGPFVYRQDFVQVESRWHGTQWLFVPDTGGYLVGLWMYHKSVVPRLNGYYVYDLGELSRHGELC